MADTLTEGYILQYKKKPSAGKVFLIIKLPETAGF